MASIEERLKRMRNGAGAQKSSGTAVSSKTQKANTKDIQSRLNAMRNSSTPSAYAYSDRAGAIKWEPSSQEEKKQLDAARSEAVGRIVPGMMDVRNGGILPRETAKTQPVTIYAQAVSDEERMNSLRQRAASATEATGDEDEILRMAREDPAGLREKIAERVSMFSEAEDLYRKLYPNSGVIDTAKGMGEGLKIGVTKQFPASMAGLATGAHESVGTFWNMINTPAKDGKVEYDDYISPLRDDALRLKEAADAASLANLEGRGPASARLVGVSQAAGNMLPGAAVGGIGGALTGGALSGLSTALISAGAGGSSYLDAIQQGAGVVEAAAYGIASGVTEYFTERLFGGNPLVDTKPGLVNHVVKKLGGSQKLLSFLASQPVETLNEGLEEAISEILNPVWQRLTYDPNADFATLDQIIDSAIDGVLLAGFMQGGSAVVERALRGKSKNADIVHMEIDRETPQNELRTAQTSGANIPSDRTVEGAAQAMSADERQARYDERYAAYNARLKAAIENGTLDEATTTELMAEADSLQRELYDIAQATRVQKNQVSENFGEADSHIDNRTAEGVGSQKVKAFQFDHPQLHQYYVDAAQALLDDAQRAIETQRSSRGEGMTYESTEQLQDAMANGLSRNDIIKACEAIINDNGQENYAAAKRVELVLDKMLSEGYTPRGGEFVAANQDYITAKEQIPGAVKVGSWEKYKRDNQLSIDAGDVTEAELRAEWEALAKEANSEYTVGRNMNTEGAENGGTEKVYLRNGGERTGSAYTGGQVSGVEEGAGRNQGRNVQSRSGNGEAAALSYGEEVSTSSLGISRGSKTKNIRLVTGGDTEATRAAQQVAREHKLRLVMFSGANLEIRQKDGSYASVRGLISGDRVFVRVDHPYFTADQIMRHEAGHYLIANGEINPDDVRERINKAFGKDKTEELAQMYIDAYAESGMTADEVWEEIICDSLGDMNIFIGNAKENPAYELLNETRKAAAESEPAMSRGPPKQKFSQDLELRGDPGNKPRSRAEWEAFNRSFANKTSDMKPGEERILFVVTGSNVYVVSADGYMQGFVDKKIPIRTKKIAELRRTFSNGNETGRNLDALAESYGRVRGQRGGDNIRAGDTGETGYAGRFSDGQQQGKGTGYYESDVEDRQGSEDVLSEDPPAGSLVYDGENSYEVGENGEHIKFSRELTMETRINESMTMDQAKQMVQRAFVLGNIKEWFDGEYKNGDEWLRGEGAEDVAMIIDNEYSLQSAYLDKIQGILDGDFYTEDVLEAYLAGTLTGKTAKKNTAKIDLASSVVVADERFYAPQAIENARALYETANGRITKASKSEVMAARAKVLLYAHNKGAAETLGLTESELNKKLRSWSNYSAKAKDISKRINSGVQASNRWTGIENMSYVVRAQITSEDVARMVKSVDGKGDAFQNNYIGRTMMALDTHIDWSWLNIKFDTYAGVNEKSSSKCNGYYLDSQRLIHVKTDAPNTVAHEMGHALDYQWARELGLHGALTEAYRNTEAVSGDARIWFDHFMEFKDSLVESSDIRSAYSGNIKETFARFVDKFVAWTEQLATGRNITYDVGYYNDKFTGSQFVQFARLLQEKAALDANGQTQNKSFSAENDKYSRDTDAEGLDNDQKNLLDAVQSGIRSTVREELDRMGKEYGWIKTGEKPAREVQVPRRTAPNNRVSQTVRTVMEAGATPDEALPTIEEMTARGDFSYEVYGDEQAISDAREYIGKDGWDEAQRKWFNDVRSGNVSKRNTTIGWLLYDNAVNTGNTALAMDVLSAMVEHQRSAAQAVQATRILKQLSPETQLYGIQRSINSLQRELNDRYKDRRGKVELKIDEDLAKKFMEAQTQEERDEVMKDIYRDIGRQMPSTFMDKWNAWRYLAMLGNVRTHVRNVAGNAFFAPVVAAKDLTATVIESAVYRVSGGKTQRTKGKVSKALLSAAWADYSKVADTVAGGGKYSDLANANRYIEEGRRIFKFKPLEAARRGNSAALEAEDAWFSQPHYAFAMAQYCQANGITEAQIRSGKGLDKARAYAAKEAQKATYRDTNQFSELVSNIRFRNPDTTAKKLANIAGEGILPFRKTPANILVRGLEYSPLGLLNGIKQSVWDVQNGKISGAEAIDNIAAGLTGTGLLGMGVYLAAQGLIRGHGGDDDDKREFEEMMGHQAYSLELPNGTSVTLDWLAPEALPFFIGVNLWETTQGDDKDVTLASMLSAVSTVAEPLLEMSCLQSLNDAFEAVGYATSNDMSGIETVLSAAATSYLTQALPTILGQAERSTEGTRMTTYTEKNGFLTSDMQYTLGRASSRIPGLDYQHIPYIDAWGRVEDSGGAIERALNNFLNPAYMSDIDTSETEAALLALYEQTGDASILPSRARKYFTVDGERKDLTAEEYVVYAQEKGQRSWELVSELTASEQYASMSDEAKVKAVKEAYDLANQVAKASVSDYKVDSWVDKAQEAETKHRIPMTTYVSLKNQAAALEGIKDRDGDTIDNSKSLRIMQAVYNTPGLTEKQRKALFEYLGVGKKVQHYNKAAVNAALAKMERQAK